MRRSIFLAVGFLTGMVAPTVHANYSTCENICIAKGNLAQYDCIRAHGTPAACQKQALMTYRSCVFMTCMSFWERWTTEEEEIPNPYVTP